MSWKLLVIFFIPLLLIFHCTEPQNQKKSNLVEKEVEYSTDSTQLKGYLVYDGNIEGKRPGVLVVHEWWGQNEYARKRARMLAELGYIALAVDMFGNGKQAGNPTEAGKYANEVFSDLSEAKAKFQAAYNLLNNQPQTKTGDIGAIGYCFGGSVVLYMARTGMDLKAVVSFHGGLEPVTPASKNTIKAKLLVCTGDADEFVPQSQIDAFKEEMDTAGVNYQLIIYPGAKHSFTNPEADENAKKFNMPVGYNKEADTDSWSKMKEFFKTNL